jgi:hypothetical protein
VHESLSPLSIAELALELQSLTQWRNYHHQFTIVKSGSGFSTMIAFYILAHFKRFLLQPQIAQMLLWLDQNF